VNLTKNSYATPRDTILSKANKPPPTATMKRAWEAALDKLEAHFVGGVWATLGTVAIGRVGELDALQRDSA
jgi:hypothetical protein